MSQQEEGDDFYAAGRRLAEHIAESSDKDISTATLQALIRDFLPQHEELQEALRSIVARPDFLQLVKLAGSGKGGAQKCALIESLRKIYSADTVEAADKLVSGIMGLIATATQNESAANNITLPHRGSVSTPKSIILQESAKAEIPDDSLNLDPIRTVQAVSSAQSKRWLIPLIALGSTVGISVWNIPGSRFDNTPSPQLNAETSGNSCTESQQDELKLIVEELTLNIELIDPYRMTGGTWQSILSTYNNNRASLPQSLLLEDYILKAKKAKELEAIGCSYP